MSAVVGTLSERTTYARRELALFDEMPPPFTFCERSDPDWLASHPSGFGTFSNDDHLFSFSPSRIAETCQHMSDDEFIMYLEAIYDWWMCTATCFMDNLTVATALEAMKHEAPDAFHQFMSHPAILSQQVTLHEWLAPER